MSTSLSSRYESKESEAERYRWWEESGFFRPLSDRDAKSAGEPYTIVIPPPNVTGILHMGHALNNTIQDILIRWERMRGKNALWVPGVDHAGIATQNVVEKKIAREQKKTRHEIGREALLQEIWTWKNQNGDTIIRQLKRLGASCDWTRERFTMDEGLSHAVRESFVTLYERGLIYQGHYIINWCPRCQTALSDEESAHKEIKGGLYHLKYPIAGMGSAAEKEGVDHIVVATTRPETMLGDTAVAVHPDDERYQQLHGKKIILPLMDREIPIVLDSFVDPQFGTGMVKVTPAHDPNDFEMGKRHHLEEINVMTPDGKINERGGAYQGLDRFEARKRVITDLEALGLFIKKDTHRHSVGHCYRCDSVVEPYLSKQWFVRMKPLAEKALEAHGQGKTKFYPDRWTKVYTNWLKNIRDWCISRQIWWGHQVPVWYCRSCRSEGPDAESRGIIVSRETPKACPVCSGTELEQDPDVLDTWFSSWLWPFSTLGWPDQTEDLKRFYPTSDLVTAPEIIFFWVARMIMAGLEFIGEVPFNRIYIHGTVRAEGGLKMSKSLGNSIDPLEVIDEMGADSLRFSMIMLSAQDVYLSREKFEVGRNFVNKLWNASRYVLMNLEGFEEGTAAFEFDLKTLSQPDLWILSRLEEVRRTVDEQLSRFGMAQASAELYHFVWNDFCDWYIELSKPVLTDESFSAVQKKTTQKVLFYVLEKIFKLLHPFTPFVTEEIWQKIKETAKDRENWHETLMCAPWPAQDYVSSYSTDARQAIVRLQNAVSGIRDLRASLNIPPSQKVDCVVCSPEISVRKTFEEFTVPMMRLAKLERLEVLGGFGKNKSFIGQAFSDFEVLINIQGLIDPVQERVRIEKKIQEVERYVESLSKKLSNDNFVKNAPEEVVEQERQKLADAGKVLKAQQESLKFFSE